MMRYSTRFVMEPRLGSGPAVGGDAGRDPARMFSAQAADSDDKRKQSPGLEAGVRPGRRAVRGCLPA